MLYNYGLIEVKPKINKKKIFFITLIIIVVISIAIYSGIKGAQYKKQKENEKVNEQIALEEQIETDKIAKVKKEEEEKRLKNANPFTESQIQAIENIYNDVEPKRVFLTFDDGPTKSVTPYILDLLKSENIKATFFVLGNRAKANPELIQREFNEGHYIANHGYSHKYSQIYQSPQTVLDEYNYTEECIQQALNNKDYHSKLFRFPGGSTGGYYNSIKKETKQILLQNGIAYLDWNSLSKDAEGAKTKEELLQNIIDTIGTKKSVIILMHDASDKILTYETLPSVIQYLRENGYEFKTIYDII